MWKRWAVLGLASLALEARGAEVPVADRGDASAPVWSLDGQWLAFEQKEGGFSSLYVVKLMSGMPVGSPQRVNLPGATSSFSGGQTSAARPVWLPQGLLIFEGSGRGGTRRLFIWKPGGQSAGELLSDMQISMDLSAAAVSPDGKAVVFVSSATGRGDLYAWDRATNRVQLLITSPVVEDAPRWSSDGKQIVFTRQNQGTEDIFIWDGSAAKGAVGGNGDQRFPVWVGDKIVYYTSERGAYTWDVRQWSPDGTARTLVKDIRLLPGNTAPPALDASKIWLATFPSQETQRCVLTLSRLDGTETRTTDLGLSSCAYPALTRVGDRDFLAFTALPAGGADYRQLHVIDITDRLRP